MRPGDKKPLGNPKTQGARKPAGSPKPARAKKIPVRRSSKLGKLIEVPRKVSRPRWVWAAGAGAVLVLVIVVWMFLPAKKGAVPLPPPAGMAAGGAAVPGAQPVAPPAVPPDAAGPVNLLPFIKAVRLQPSTPTRTDSLKATVEAAPGAPQGLAYTFLWKVNDRTVEAAKGDTLSLADFKKGDRVAVIVTPRDGDNAGFAVESPAVAIHSIAPSLELEIKPPAAGSTEPAELKLVSVAPESTKLTFKLEPPLLAGMTIDANSGKIAWPREKGQRGVFHFGASVQDDNGTKVTKTFDVTIK